VPTGLTGACATTNPCGTCNSNSTCINNTCVFQCNPNCAGRVCGPDGCGGQCSPNNCGTGLYCDNSGLCQSVGNCTRSYCILDNVTGLVAECGFDCGVPCGPIRSGETQATGTCRSNNVNNNQPYLCLGAEPSLCQCLPSCAGRQCGDDGCGVGRRCGNCSTGQYCDGRYCRCQPSCVNPDLSVRTCGGDGCGGSCGNCTGPQDICEETRGSCVCVPTCEPAIRNRSECGVTDGCTQALCVFCNSTEECFEARCIQPGQWTTITSVPTDTIIHSSFQDTADVLLIWGVTGPYNDTADSPEYYDDFNLFVADPFIRKWASRLQIGADAIGQPANLCNGTAGEIFCECKTEDSTITDELDRYFSKCEDSTLLCGPVTGLCLPTLDPYIFTPPNNFMTDWLAYRTRSNAAPLLTESSYITSAFEYCRDRARYRPMVGFNGSLSNPDQPTRSDCVDCQISWATFELRSISDLALSSFEQLDHYNRWLDIASLINEDPDRPENVGDVIIWSDNWVKMLTEVTAVQNIALDFGITLLTAFLSMLIFTANLMVTFLGMLVLVGCAGALFSLFYFFGWQLGIVEALCASVLIGLCVDYIFHLAEVYNDTPNTDSRNTRLRQGMTRMGFALIMGGLVTTVATAALMICQIQAFFKFGVLLTTATFASILYTMTLFAALLSLCGPTGRRCQIPLLEKWHGDHDIDKKMRIDPAIFEGSKAAN
jgi:hypothetical protein